MDMREINAGVIADFRANDGQLSGPMAGAPILLLTTSGRTTGNPHTTPVGFIDSSGRLAVAAANGGSDAHPDWYRNIENDPQVTIEVAGGTVEAVAEIVHGSERQQLLTTLTESLPGMSEHVASTPREIPVVRFSETG